MWRCPRGGFSASQRWIARVGTSERRFSLLSRLNCRCFAALVPRGVSAEKYEAFLECAPDDILAMLRHIENATATRKRVCAIGADDSQIRALREKFVAG